MNVIITGASKGLGRAIAEKFAASGNNLFVCSRSEVQLYNMMDEMMLQYPQCHIKARPADLSQKDQAVEFGNWCLQYGIPGILINNAGLFVPGGVHDEPDGALEEMIAVNLYSAYYLTRTVLPKMIEAGNGHIFNMCSIASIAAYNNGGAYSISKFALLGFSKNLREEMKPHNIKVTSILPGAAFTESWSGSGVDPKRIMEANDIAEMVYTASKLSAQACVEEILLRPQLGDL
ncbi:MAG TPA: SDR family oxidoreductase [Panacibacter sp.]|nr:SDR family oxidoreductase [Panacibacter sp.]HNP43014.1 SDR family oxidoreductase [Panacibacter sp.]